MLPPVRRGADGIYGSAGHKVVGWRVSTDSERVSGVRGAGWRTRALIGGGRWDQGGQNRDETFEVQGGSRVARGRVLLSG